MLLAGWAAELTSRSSSTPFKQPRPVSSRSACMLRCPRHPARTTPQAQPQGALNSHSGHRCARPRTQGRAQRWPEWFPYPCGRAEKRRAGGGRGQRSMPALRALTGCSCLSGALQARSEFCSATARSSIAGCPAAQRRGHGQWGRLLLPSFLGETRKEGAPPGACPGLTTSPARKPSTSATVHPAKRLQIP